MRLGMCMRNVDECIRAFHVDVANDDIGEVVFTNNLNEMRRLTGAKVVTILSAEIGGRRVRIIAPSPSDPASKNGKVSGLDTSNKVVLHGSLVITGRAVEDGDEVLASLPDEAMKAVKDSIALVDIGGEDNKYNTYVVCGVGLI